MGAKASTGELSIWSLSLLALGVGMMYAVRVRVRRDSSPSSINTVKKRYIRTKRSGKLT